MGRGLAEESEKGNLIKRTYDTTTMAVEREREREEEEEERRERGKEKGKKVKIIRKYVVDYSKALHIHTAKTNSRKGSVDSFY